MKLYALIDKDIVVGKTTLSNDIRFPNELIDVELSLLRFTGTTIVLVSEFSIFYVDEFGKKHIVQHDLNWQKVECQHDDILVQCNEYWCVETESDKFQKRYIEVDDTRRELYAKISDPLRFEALAKKEDGDIEEASILNQQAKEARKKIQSENPWPTPPELSSEV